MAAELAFRTAVIAYPPETDSNPGLLTRYRERRRLSPKYFFIRADLAARPTAVHPGARVAVREAASGARSPAGAIDSLRPARDLPAGPRVDGTARSRGARV